MYKTIYLPIAREDIEKAVLYIAEHLKAEKAALDLLDSLDTAIGRLAEFPYAHRLYSKTADFSNEYRILPVKNYLVFYTIDEEQKIVEIYRVLYAKRDWKNII